MQRRLLSYLLLISLPFWLNTCYSGCQECKDLPFTTDVRNYFLDFKEGSYWIYRNVANGDIDSVYFVGEDIQRMGGARGRATCFQEYAGIGFLGIVDSLRLGFYITSWNNSLEANGSDAVFVGDYNTNQTTKETFGAKSYEQVIALENCCLTSNCYGCKFKDFRMQRMYFAPQVGLVGWEAENYPQYGNVTYELIRYNINR